MSNHLAHESSPYLLQHANNPVDWYPWGPEALERAKREDRPIFLSIGYSACHWCHVMEHESFENPAIAARLNELFVNIKVDREERPDLDQIYMQAVQLISGRGGWPMSMFLTPDLRPFYGGTYWPPSGRMGMPGFDQVIAAVDDAWKNRRQQALEQAQQLTAHLDQLGRMDTQGDDARLSADLLTSALAFWQRIFDREHGGFGGAPKFPHAIDMRALMRIRYRQPNASVLALVTRTLDKMAGGGIYDQLGGGFHRYSVDERWLVPHFEKMLYDNALLVPCYLEAWAITGNEDYARVVRETCDYILREMTHPEGGFSSTQDADSEGEEGKFYVWTPQEITEVLGPERAKRFCYAYDCSDAGNFEGHNILNRPKTHQQVAQILQREPSDLQAELDEGRQKLLAVREKRIHPGLDDKVLVSWNGMMIEAMALTGAMLDEPRYLKAAERAADFIWQDMRRADGRLWHTWRGGKAKLDAYLDDYAAMACALVTLYECTFDERRVDQALAFTQIILDEFSDPQGGGFFYTAASHEQLISRQKDAFDSSVPSGNSLAIMALLRLGKLTGRADLTEAGLKALNGFAGVIRKQPTGTAQMLMAIDFHLGPTPELVLVGTANEAETQESLRELRRRFIPNRVLASRGRDAAATTKSKALDPLFEGRDTATQPTLYVCEHFTCEAPIIGVEAIAQKWESMSRDAGN